MPQRNVTPTAPNRGIKLDAGSHCDARDITSLLSLISRLVKERKGVKEIEVQEEVERYNVVTLYTLLLLSLMGDNLQVGCPARESPGCTQLAIYWTSHHMFQVKLDM